jgi:hypothetical protein
MDEPSPASYLAGLSGVAKTLAEATHDLLISAGCTGYVKTIYIGYDIEGEMVAALYGHQDHIEVALALPEDAEHPLLIDASHLTWRTLPVAAVVREHSQLGPLAALIDLACERVRTQQHEVMRDNDFFTRARRGGRGTRPTSH